MSKLVVNRREVEIHFAGILRFGRACFQLDDEKGPQLQMVKQEIDEGFLTADFELNLPAHQGEAGAEFEQETFDVREKFIFQHFFARRFGERQEVENIRVARGLLGQVGLWWRQVSLKLVRALPARRWRLLSIWIRRMARDHPCSNVFLM